MVVLTIECQDTETKMSSQETATNNPTEDCTGFDSSDDELGEELDKSPFPVDWLDFSDMGFSESLGISSLPGCRFKDNWRCLETDIKTVKSEGIEDVFVLCTRGELYKYRVPRLLQEYAEADMNVHHYPFQDGNAPPIQTCIKLLEELRVNLSKGTKTLLHCYGGLGRSCLLAACLMLDVNEELKPEDAIQRLRSLKGAGAIQTVRQYNFVNDFRKFRDEYLASCGDREPRSVSR